MHKEWTVEEAVDWLMTHVSGEQLRIPLSELETARQLEAKGTISVREVHSDNAGTIAAFIKLTSRVIQGLEKP